MSAHESPHDHKGLGRSYGKLAIVETQREEIATMAAMLDD